MKNHDCIQNQLSAYLDNELSFEERAVVQAHLSTCDECIEMRADFQRNRQWIAALEHEAPPIADLVLAQLPDRGSVWRQFLRSFNELWNWVCRPVIGGVGALVTVGLGLALIYFNSVSSLPEDARAFDPLELYLAVHTEHVAYNPLRSNAVADSFGGDINTPDTMVEDNTDFLLEVHLGD